MKKYVSALIAVCLLCGCSQSVEVSQSEDNTKLVRVTQIGEENIGDTISLSGNVVPVSQAAVSFKQAGVIEQVYVKEGDSVKAGDKLAALKSSDYQLKLEAAKAQTAGANAQSATASAGVSAAQAQADAALSQVETAQAALDAAISQRDTAQLQIDTEIPSKTQQAKQQLDLTETNYDTIKQLYDNGVATKNQFDEISAKLEVDKQTYQQALDAKAVAQSKLKAAEAQIKAAQSTKQAAQSTYDAAMAQVNAARSTTAAAQAQTGAAAAQQKAADNSLEDTVIYSPIDGVVLKKVMNSGETVGAGTPVVVVASNDKMWIRVGVPDNYINRIKKGQKALINVYGLENTIEGSVDEIGALADTATRTFTVNIIADNRDNALKAGMICSADIVLSNDSKILVPVDSVISMPEPEGDVVYVYDEKNAAVKKVGVETGSITGDKIEITKGLSIGDKLVTEGQFVLNDGDRVTAEVTEND